VEVPILIGKNRNKAGNILRAAGLELGAQVEASSEGFSEGRIVDQYPRAGSNVERGTPVRVTVAHRQYEEPAVEKAPKRRFYPKPDSSPEESELRREVESSSQRSEKSPSDRGRKPEKPQDLPD
jgi:beta-lactam-binding protein with PASTA domain